MSDTDATDEAGTDDPAEGDHPPDESHESEFATERTTAPQSPYSTRDVVVGLVVAIVGMGVVFGIPLLLA